MKSLTMFLFGIAIGGLFIGSYAAGQRRVGEYLATQRIQGEAIRTANAHRVHLPDGTTGFQWIVRKNSTQRVHHPNDYFIATDAPLLSSSN